MAMHSNAKWRLGLRAGDVVQVRGRDEILATLDSRGRLEGLPFMPEMLAYCGRQFRVVKRAEKTCDTIHKTGARRMFDCVHLEGVRCDGQAHGGCQAMCLLFWKEAWLTRLPRAASASEGVSSVCTEAVLQRETHAAAPEGPDAGEVFSCQATELFNATSYMAWWDPRQYVRDVRSGNVTVRTVLRGLAIAVFNAIQRRRHGGTYPLLYGYQTTTPTARLDLNPGERVKIKTKEQILDTLDDDCRNRGLSFDVEMVRYCDRQFTVLARPERIINEKTGRMLRLTSDCIVLDGVTCVGDLSSRPNRLFCPRSIYPFWREIWLERTDAPEETAS